MRRKAKNISVSHEDVQQAINKFMEQGGLIKQLPDQIVTRHSQVGSRWGMYEPVMENSEVMPEGK